MYVELIILPFRQRISRQMLLPPHLSVPLPAASTHTLSRERNAMKVDNPSRDYKPSPYSSILPRVHLTKTKPLIQVVDVPPAAAEGVASQKDGSRSESDIDGQASDIAENSSSPQSAAVPVQLAEEHPTDTKFVKIISSSSSDQPDHSSANPINTQPIHTICSTCTKNIARYTCPKCSTPYCSVECYKIHDGTIDSNNQKICTESFYKNRVLSEYHARGSEEDKLKLRGILNRLHQDIDMQMTDVEWRDHCLSELLHEKDTSDFNREVVNGLNEHDQALAHANMDLADQIISDEDLAELALYILNLDEEEDQDADSAARVQQLKETLPPHLLDAFEFAMASALGAECKDEEEDGLNLLNERNKQQLNDKWRPWWLSEMDQDTNPNASILSPNLDERILSIQPLPSLTSQTSNHNLSYNILDVLFAATFALRITCESSSSAAENAADVLLAQSLVLTNNAIYESVYSALSACAERFVEINRSICKSTSLSWDRLATDVAMISCNRRFVLRTLFEAADLLKSGIEVLKVHTKALKKKVKSEYTEKKRALDETKRQCKLAVKKIEYFQSWCSSKWSLDLGQEIFGEVESFVDHWKMPEKEEGPSQIESMLGNMLSNDDANSTNDDTFGMIASRDNHFRMGKELVAVSSVSKMGKKQ
jgi:hypothetical protein